MGRLSRAECFAVLADSSLPGQKVADVLDGVALEHGYLQQITVDNGTEFYSAGHGRLGVPPRREADFIRPGMPMENSYIESFQREASRRPPEC